MKKPKGCTYPDCFVCLLDDCEYDIEGENEGRIDEIEALDEYLATMKSLKKKGERLMDMPTYRKALVRREYLVNHQKRIDYQREYLRKKRERNDGEG